ncbi:hypothetical protein ODS41_00330 [Pyrobaculum sp. 3827-6]|uniref:hypothetical protein n=1 Tax=Pyrobaculum sp. 3827-6 TaxID=2983604 RepID=UPI0021D919A8|nr:hypothetical protein [Pyrobaculum sp. 3827-6]MCU7786379.1 hypothetical protein [Pyrobaculum sp. 3827-6]
MEKCFSRALAELNYLVSSLKLLEDWQLVARIALIISIFIEGSRQCGYDGAAMARQYIISALEKAGVDRHKKYRAYLHGLRSEVVSVLREIFPNLIDLNLKSPRELKRMVTDTEYAASIQPFETKTISLPKECFPEALIALEDVIAAYYKLDDWQFISRTSMVIQKFIEEGVEMVAMAYPRRRNTSPRRWTRLASTGIRGISVSPQHQRRSSLDTVRHFSKYCTPSAPTHS